MAHRLVLGGGSLGRTIAERLADRPGGVQVVTDDESRAASLVEEGVPVVTGDPTAAETLAEVESPAVVAVASDDPAENVAAARTVREVFPTATLIAYTGYDDPGSAATLRELADRVVDPAAETTAFLMARVGDGAVRIRQIQRVLRDIDRLAIVTHDNPDPDAIASAVALGRIAERVGCTVDVCYFGNITHQENRAFVNLLGFDLRNLDPGTDLSGYDGFALVDHSRPGVNDQLPEDLSVDVVVDHHPPRAPVEARFVDLRSDVGATSTLLVEYLDTFGVPLTEDIATGLLFGIRVDTKEFTREAGRADFEAAATLLPHADLGTLERIESPSISPGTFDILASAIGNRIQEGSVVLSSVGYLSDRDALAQAADRLLMLEDVTTTVVFGVQDGTIYVSARSRGAGVDLGETLRDAFGAIGSAGGHADMAGAQITLGVLEAVEDREESLLEVVEAVVVDRFLEALDGRSDRRVTGVYTSDYDADEFLPAAQEFPTDADAATDGPENDPGPR
jgi:nanoRNase/pAp phosphatase (c-di-AMP/oligoRNAs hydrolase)